MRDKPFPYPAAVVVGFLSRDPELVERVSRQLAGELGPVRQVLPPIPFTFSDYYEKEMGAGLLRSWHAYAKRCRRDSLAALKHLAIEMERNFLQGDRRQINIDPGLLTLENFSLATTKNFSHRLYLQDGIFAELTLIYEGKGYQPLPWTYPDYRSPQFQAFALDVRQQYKDALDRPAGRGEVFWPSRA